jgi:hypothetical protein
MPFAPDGTDAMAEARETLTHPILGRLEWEAQYGYWSGQRPQPRGGMVDLQIKPADPSRRDRLKRAGDLFLWAMENEVPIRLGAVDNYLYDLYQHWRQEEDPSLSAETFGDLLEWGMLAISDSEIVPVVFWYDDAGHDFFGGHVIVVKLDAELKYRDAHLVG